MLQTQVYETIYDMVAENYKKAGKHMAYEKQAFLCNVTAHPQIIDVSRYQQLSRLQFCQAVCMAVYRRLPKAWEYEKWGVFSDGETFMFRKNLLKKLSVCSVAAQNRIRLTRNPYVRQHMGIRYRLAGLLYVATDKPSLRQLGKKLPEPVQQIIRKVLL